MDNHTVGHYTAGVSACPTMRGAEQFPSTSYLFYAWCIHSLHIFILHKSNTDETQIPNAVVVRELFRYLRLISIAFV